LLLKIFAKHFLSIYLIKIYLRLTDEEYIDFVADFLKPTPIEWVFVVLFFILMVVGICGNCLVVYVVSRFFWRNFKIFNYFFI